METSKVLPSLPPNYVSLAQLQERWLKEQERKQEERKQREREEEERKQMEREGQERKREDDDVERQNRNGVKSETKSGYVNHRSFRRNRGRQSQKNFTLKVREPKADELEIEAVVGLAEAVTDQEQNDEETKKRQSKISEVNDQGQKDEETKKRLPKKKWRNRRPKAKEDLTGSTAQQLPEKEAEGKISVVVAEGNDEKEKIGSELPVIGEAVGKEPVEVVSAVSTEGNGGKGGNRRQFGRKGRQLMLNPKLSSQSVPASQWVEIGLRNMSLHERSRIEVNGHRRYNRGPRNFNRQHVQNPRDGGLVWVRKGGISDTDDPRIQS